MRRINYVVAGLYLQLKRKRSGSLPYFNLRLIIVTMLFLHYFQLDILLEKYFQVNLFPKSDYLFIATLISVAWLLAYLLSVLFPLEELQEVAVAEKDVKWIYRAAYFYMMINVGLLGYLMVSNSHL